jgi:uncharacterized protein
VKDLAPRELLVPGKRQSLDIKSVRLMSRQIDAGSRLIVVLSIVKESGREINYGTGKEVIEESIADAKAPLQIKWLSSSHIDFPQTGKRGLAVAAKGKRPLAWASR